MRFGTMGMHLKAAIFAVCFFVGGQVLAAPYSVKTLAHAYNSGHFFEAQQIAERRIQAEPNDFGARYYLANTYLKLNKTDQAIEQYRACANSGAKANTSLAKYSSKALQSLLQQKEFSLMAAAAEKPSEAEIKAFRARIQKETAEENTRIHKEWMEAQQRHSAKYSNRAYPIDYRRMNNDRVQIDQTYMRKLKEVADNEQTMLSQANCGKGRIRIAPSLSSSKVKNYVNYGGEADTEYIPVDNALRAEAKKLNTGGKTTSTKPAKTRAHGRSGK